MARAIWKGSLSFGLVNIPVEVHVAVRDHRPRFHLLHATDKSPVRFSRVCEKEGRPVAWKDLVKGYEYSRGHFVVLTKEDFQAAALEKTKRIDIIDFVAASDIDDRYFETPYYLVPVKGGEHAYALLREAIRATERIGIAKFMLRETMHLSAVEVIDDALVLTLMRFADELVDASTLALPPQSAFRKPELEVAKSLVQTLAADWTPDKYTDEYRDNLKKIINAKLKGKHIEVVAPAKQPPATVTNLMDRLRESLAAARADTPRGRSARARAKPSAHAGKKRARRAA